MSATVASSSNQHSGHTASPNLPSSMSLHTRKVSRIESAKKRRKEAEAKAAKMKAQRAEHTFDMWNIAKQQDRKEKQRYYEGKIAKQHNTIKKQDEMYEKHKKQLEEKQKQIKEVKRLNRLSKERHMEEIAKQSLAEDRAKMKKLKSHFRVISSHAPRKASNVEDEAQAHKQEEVVLSKSDEYSTTSSPEEEPLTYLDEDLTELIDAPLEVQLEKILGLKEAEEVLKPSFREGARRTLNPLLLRRRVKGAGAKEVWNTLRTQSRQKLLHEDSMIETDIKNAYAAFVRECLRRHVTPVQRSFTNDEEIPLVDQLSESQLLGDVRFMRHRLDLMHRVAHMNKDKTKMLLHQIEPPDFNDTKGKDGLRRYIPDEELNQQTESPRIPQLQLCDSEGQMGLVVVNPSPVPSTSRTSYVDTSRTSKRTAKHSTPEPVYLNGEKITFLTEKKACCEGEFSKRQKEKGMSSDISMKGGSQVKSNPALSVKSLPVTLQLDEKEKKKKVVGDEKEETHKAWEPLTLRALTEYQQTVPLFGAGDYSQGIPKKWKSLDV